MKDEVTKQELEEARRELQQKMVDMKHGAENLESVRLERKTIQTQRALNLEDDTQIKVSNDHQDQIPHVNRPAQDLGVSSKEEREEKVKEPQGRTESIQGVARQQDTLSLTVSLDEFKVIQDRLNSVVDNQAALEQRVQQLEQDMTGLRRYHQAECARREEEKKSSCIVQ